jgi:hypothetical protein
MLFAAVRESAPGTLSSLCHVGAHVRKQYYIPRDGQAAAYLLMTQTRLVAQVH